MSDAKHRASSPKRFGPAFIVVPIVLIALGVGAFLLFRGDDPSGDAGTGALGEPDDPSVPEFAFTVAESRAVPTSQTGEKQLRDPARSATKDAASTLDELYTEAFLDQDSWQTGSYEAVWDLFEGSARAAAEEQAAALTAGPAAGDTFQTILPRRGRAEVSVLMDERDHPVALEVTVVFAAEATGEDGTVTRLISTGDYFLRRFGPGWKVTSFDVQRADSSADPAAEATPAEASS